MNEIISVLNENKIMSGLTILILNLGSRYISGDLTKVQELLFTNNYFKKIILLSMFFVATRDILMSLLLTISYVVFIDFLLNETSKFCILPSFLLDKKEDKFDNYIKNIIKLNNKDD